MADSGNDPDLMTTPTKYLAAPVPRFIRQTKLGYIPVNCIIGSRLVRGATGSNLAFDIVMLPAMEFQRMRTNVGLHHVLAPSLKADASFNPAFVLSDIKEVVVPAEESDPIAYARNYFIAAFNLANSDEAVLHF